MYGRLRLMLTNSGFLLMVNGKPYVPYMDIHGSYGSTPLSAFKSLHVERILAPCALFLFLHLKKVFAKMVSHTVLRV